MCFKFLLIITETSTLLLPMCITLFQYKNFYFDEDVYFLLMGHLTKSSTDMRSLNSHS